MLEGDRGWFQRMDGSLSPASGVDKETVRAAETIA